MKKPKITCCNQNGISLIHQHRTNIIKTSLTCLVFKLKTWLDKANISLFDLQRQQNLE